MRKIKYIFYAIPCLAAMLCSCTKEEGGSTPDGGSEAVEQAFSFTRADGNGDPEHADTYTMISYMLGGPTSTTVDKQQIKIQYQSGYYAYDANGDYDQGALIPVAVNTSSPYGTNLTGGKLTKDRAKAQKLNVMPAGNNQNNTGIYRTAMIHPAIPMRNTTNLGYLAVFEQADDIWASLPDDADGSGNPFEVRVRSNQQVHDIPAGTKLFPVKSAVKVYMYSNFYAEDDTEKNNPLSVDFTVEEMRLINSGSNGWYSARQGIVYPNYNYINRNTYSSTPAFDDMRPNYVTLTAAVTNDEIPLQGGGTAQAKYIVDKYPVFPSDYRGAEGGGLAEVIPMTLSLKLKETSSGALNNASVPIAIQIERGKCYTFYVNVTSEQIVVSYSISGWDPAGENDDDIGGDVVDYTTVDINRGTDGWENGGGGNESIGQ